MGSTRINNGSYESLQDSEHDSLSNDTGGSDKSGIGNNNSTGTTTRLVSHEKQPSREDSLIVLLILVLQNREREMVLFSKKRLRFTSLRSPRKC